MTMLMVVFMCVALVLGLRCLYIQGFDPAGNASRALMPDTIQIPATRGTVTDRNGQVIAESIAAVNITADPTIVATNGGNPETMSLGQRLRAQAGPGIIAGMLVAHLNGDFDTYYHKLSQTKTEEGGDIRYVMLSRSVLNFTNLQLQQRLGALGYLGLFREQAPVRHYPNGTLAANVIGYMTFSDELAAENKYPWMGGDGLEYSHNTPLAGVDGQEVYETSPYGRIASGTSIIVQPREGISYTTTIDLGMQYMQDQRLAAAVQQNGARSGMAITMTVTGEILAMSTYPSFDPNDISRTDPENLGNRVIRDASEPGSVHKVITMAILLDQGLISPYTQVVVPDQIKSGDAWITDSWPHPEIYLTAAGVLARSSNIGTALLARNLDKTVMSEYLALMGLGSATNIGLPVEAVGYIPDGSMSDQTRDHIAFGQGLSVTALQEASAIAALVNGGVYISPTIIKSATTSDGKPIDLPAPSVRRVIAESSSRQLLDMMETAAAFSIPGYRVGGKSGTAEAIDPECGCYRGYVASYIGVAPVENPYLLTYVVFDHPVFGWSGTLLGAPVVQDILQVALPRYGVPTSTTPPSDIPREW
jgi:cell division protein FtsI (penicillin-binding protein 3)